MEEREEIKVDARLDAIGLYCPMPIILTTKKLKELKVGDILEITADDEGVKKDIPQWCKQTGNEFIQIEEDEGIFKVIIRKLKE
ncbi:MAG: sulfurtransferase TusA family protein [Nitrospirota bacterium]